MAFIPLQIQSITDSPANTKHTPQVGDTIDSGKKKRVTPKFIHLEATSE